MPCCLKQYDLQRIGAHYLSFRKCMFPYARKIVDAFTAQPHWPDLPQGLEERYKPIPSRKGLDEHESEDPEQELGKEAGSIDDNERNPVEKFHSTRCDRDRPPRHVNDRSNTSWYWDWDWDWENPVPVGLGVSIATALLGFAEIEP